MELSPHPEPASRPEILYGWTFQVESPYGMVFVTLNEDHSRSPFELFLNVGKCGSDLTADAEAIGRLCSMLLRLPSPVSNTEKLRSIIRHLSGIGGSRHQAGGHILSVPDAVAKALRMYLVARKQTLLQRQQEGL
jgi:ribonucleoside-diphosphate reductase alpha chain